MGRRNGNKGHIIAVANQKGGVGKTTLAVHLSAWLAGEGKKVVLVDADPQGNATSWLLDGDVSDPGLFRLLVVGDPLVKVVRFVSNWGFGLLPGNDRTGETMKIMWALEKPFGTVASALRPLGVWADYVLIDMPPSKAAGFRELLFTADWTVVPTQLERLSLEGVRFMAQTCQKMIAEKGDGPRLLGVVPNMVRRRTIEHREKMDELVGVFGSSVWPAIPLSVRVAEACSFGLSMFEFAPKEKATRSLKLIGQRLIENTGARYGKETAGK